MRAIKFMCWIGSGIGVCIVATVFLIAMHAKHPHPASVPRELYSHDQELIEYRLNQLKTGQDEIRKDLKVLLEK